MKQTPLLLFSMLADSDRQQLSGLHDAFLDADLLQKFLSVLELSILTVVLKQLTLTQQQDFLNAYSQKIDQEQLLGILASYNSEAVDVLPETVNRQVSRFCNMLNELLEQD